MKNLALSQWFWIILVILLSIAVFYLIMLYFRKILFKFDGNIFVNKKAKEIREDIRSKEREYHGSSIYKCFTFYLQIVLATLGGISFIALHKQENVENAKNLISLGGWIIIVATILFVSIVLNHHLSKMIRWTRRFKKRDIFFWPECWVICAANILAVITNLVLIPNLISNL